MDSLDGSPFVSSSDPNVIIETVKQAEDGSGIIIRVYESMRKRSRARFDCIFDLRSAWKTDLLENNLEKLDIRAGGIEFELKPFEVATFRLVPNGPN